MKISQLIEQLKQTMELEGDIEIVSRENESLAPRVDVVGVRKPLDALLLGERRSA